MSLLSMPQTGRWRDHSEGHSFQTLQHDSWRAAQWFKVGIAISLTLASPYVLRIVISTISCVKYYRSPAKTPNTRDDEAAYRLVPTGTVKTAISTEGGWKYLASSIIAQEPSWEARHRFFRSFLLASVLLVLYQSIVGTVLTDNVARSRSALLKSDVCGLYEYDNKKGGEEDAVRADILMVGRERRAAAYAQDCYDPDTKVKATKCDFFYNSSIGYDRREDTCPFQHTEVCVGRYQPGAAITFDTNLVDSGVLGINEESMHKFRRKTTCAPLSADWPFVEHFTNSRTNESGYRYLYGQLWDTKNCSEKVLLSKYTLRMTGHPFEWQAPVYKVDTYATSLLDTVCDFYQPSEYLNATGLLQDITKTLSLFFVTTLRILYTKPSYDPIFTADKAFRYHGDQSDYYYNSQPKARAFACIDETIFCAPSGSPCWHANDAVPDGGYTTPSYWLLKYALKSSNTYDAIKLRLGSGLLAQERVGQSRSMPLPNDHWQHEAEHLFKSSLARAQFDAWSIASAEDHDNPTYTDTLPDEAKGKMCGLFKFQASGYVNIAIIPFVWLMLAWPIVFLLSVELKTYVATLYLVKSWLASMRKKSAQADAGSSETTETAIDGVSQESAAADQNISSTPVVVVTTSPSHGVPADTTASYETAAPDEATPPDEATASETPSASPDHPHAEPTPGTSSTTNTTLQPSDASTSTLSATATTASQRPDTATSTTPLIPRPPGAASTDASQSYGTTSSARSTTYSTHKSDQAENSEWSPLLIHGPIVLGVWMYKKMRNRGSDAREDGEVV